MLIDAKADVNASAETGSYNGLNALNIAIERKGDLSNSSKGQAAKEITQMLEAAGAHE